MRILILSFCLIGQFFAQTTYYVKPMINTKISLASNSPRRFDDEVFNSNPYYIYDNKSLIFSGLNNFDFGIGIGLAHRKKHSFEMCFNTDGTGSGFRLYYNYKSSNNEFYQTDRMYIYGKAINRISLNYTYLKSNKYHFSIGLSYGFKPPSLPGKLDQSYYENVVVSENVIMSQEVWVVGFNRSNFYTSFGFGRDFFSKKKYLFSFDLLLVKGYNLISGVATTITIYNNGNKTANNYLSYSKGSGIYFQLSRRFTYPSKTKKPA